MTLDEREEQAEKNFNVIKAKILQRNPDRFATDKNFVRQNISTLSKMSIETSMRQQNMSELIKNKHLLAKQRRDQNEEQNQKQKILQLFRWPLIRYIRSQQLGQKHDELEVIRFAREWRIRMSFYDTIGKLYEIFRREMFERRLKFAKFIVAISMVKRLKTEVLKKGPTFDIRQIRISRNYLNLSMQCTAQAQNQRAKNLFTDFIQTCYRNISFKTYLYEFIDGTNKIMHQMHNRLEQHELKFEFLDQLFEQELKNMKVYAFKHTRQKKFKILALKLANIESNQKNALLREYFSVCKMIYRINSMVAYTWDMSKDHNDLFDNVMELYSENETFAKMISIVYQSLNNIFSGTDPNHQLIEEQKKETKKVVQRKTSLLLSRKSIREQFQENAKRFQTIKENHYDAVAHLIPDNTDIMHRILQALAEFEILKSPTFRATLRSLKLKAYEALVARQLEEKARMLRESSNTTSSISPQRTSKRNSSANSNAGAHNQQSFLTSLPNEEQQQKIKKQSSRSTSQNNSNLMQSKRNSMALKNNSKTNREQKRASLSPNARKKRQQSMIRKSQQIGGSKIMAKNGDKSATNSSGIHQIPNEDLQPFNNNASQELFEDLETEMAQLCFIPANQLIQSDEANMLQQMIKSQSFTDLLKTERDRLVKQLINLKHYKSDSNNVMIKLHQQEKRRIPVFRYIPSRYIIQRLIIKATLLPKDFTQFDEQY